MAIFALSNILINFSWLILIYIEILTSKDFSGFRLSLATNDRSFMTVEW